jgi:trans-aconitate methyltransferase
VAIIAEQHWSARRYAETAHFVPNLGAQVLELLAPRAGERILDLGCGDGVLTEKIVAEGAEVVGVDASPDMVASARARGIDARVMPGQNLTFDREFDAVFSNAALHWMRPPEAVLAGVRRALKEGGRLIGEMGGHNNTAAIFIALSAVLARRGLDAHRLSPWYFPSAAAYREKLEAAGFTVEDIRIVPRPTMLPTSIEPWLDTFCEAFFGALREPDRTPARGEVAALLRPVLVDETIPGLPITSGCVSGRRYPLKQASFIAQWRGDRAMSPQPSPRQGASKKRSRLQDRRRLHSPSR